MRHCGCEESYLYCTEMVDLIDLGRIMSVYLHLWFSVFHFFTIQMGAGYSNRYQNFISGKYHSYCLL